MEQVTLFISTFVMIFLAEMGDKTQLLVMSLTSKYKIFDVVCGVFLSICFLNIIAVFLGGIITDFLPMELISLISGFSFIGFAFSGLRRKKNDEKIYAPKFPSVLAVFCIFFIAELGDKTQLSVIALSASQNKFTFPVLAAAITGMFFSDCLGLLFVKSFKRNISQKNLNLISVLVFALFGILTLYRSFVFYFGNPAGTLISALTAVMTLGIIIYKSTKYKKKLG